MNCDIQQIDKNGDGKLSAGEFTNSAIYALKMAGHQAIYSRNISEGNILHDMSSFKVDRIEQSFDRFRDKFGDLFPGGIESLSEADVRVIADAASKIRRAVGDPKDSSWRDVIASGVTLAANRFSKAAGEVVAGRFGKEC